MAIDPELLDLFDDVVSIAPPSAAPDLHAATTAGTAVDYPARVEGRSRMVRDVSGRDRLSNTQIYIPEFIDGIGPDWFVTLPARYANRTPPIVAVEQNMGGDGEGHHIVVFLGSTGDKATG